MELLKIEHKDFTLSIECAKYSFVSGKAKQNVGEGDLTSTYSWSEEAKVKRLLDNGDEVEIDSQGKPAPAIFFDNTDYPIWVEFGDKVTNARFDSMLQSDSKQFSYHKSHRILTGFINYGNDIGRSVRSRRLRIAPLHSLKR